MAQVGDEAAEKATRRKVRAILHDYAHSNSDCTDALVTYINAALADARAEQRERGLVSKCCDAEVRYRYCVKCGQECRVKEGRPTSKLTSILHTAICQAVGLLNVTINDSEQRQAHDILRQALVDYADATAIREESGEKYPMAQINDDWISIFAARWRLDTMAEKELAAFVALDYKESK
jgi:hypothetical protein